MARELSTRSNFPFDLGFPFGDLGLVPRSRYDEPLMRTFRSIFGPSEDAFNAMVAIKNWEIEENDEAYTATALIPGFTAEEVRIEVQDGTLIAKGEKSNGDSTSEDGDKPQAHWSQKWSLQLRLPKGTDKTGITAKVDAGVLTVTIPRGGEETERFEVKVT